MCVCVCVHRSMLYCVCVRECMCVMLVLHGRHEIQARSLYVCMQ